MVDYVAREQWTLSLMGGAETAQIGWCYQWDSSTDLLSDLNTLKDTFWGAVRSKFSSATEITERALVIRDPASNALVANFALDLPTDPTGTSGIDWLPPQLAIVLSLRTANPGRSYRGRIYLPGFSRSAMTDHGRVVTTTRDTLADEFRDYMDAVAGAAAGAIPSVYSPTLHVLTPLQSVVCGDVFDTQRRRRNALVEARHTAMLA